MTKKKNDKIPPVILFLIYAGLLFGMYTSLSTLALGLWGQTIMGTVDTYSKRLDNAGGEANRSRTIFKGYHFTVGGKEYRGYVIYKSDEAWPDLKEGKARSERIRYLTFFPHINKPSALADFSRMGEGAIIYHILAPLGCIFLLRLVTGTLKREKQAKKRTPQVSALQNKHTKGNINLFCQNCGQGLPEGVAFCSQCGVKTQQDSVNCSSKKRGGFTMHRFDTMLEAAEFAATLCAAWTFAYADEKYDKKGLLVTAETHDQENPADEDSFYVVSPAGAIGFCAEGENIDWLFLTGSGTDADLPAVFPTASPKNFCTKCGAGVIPDARFCGNCGAKL